MRFPPRSTLTLALLALAWLSPAGAGAQSLAAMCPSIPVPFGPGEEATYQLKFGVLNAGEGRLAVTGVDTLRGHASYQLELELDGGIPLARVRYDFRSWMDTGSLVSRRHTRDMVEIRTPRHRFYEIYPEERRWRRTDTGEEGETLHPCPLDDLSFIYYLRAQPLIPGETLTLNRYFKEDGNPVKVEVVGRDRVEVPAGTFNTVVVRPTIRTSGLFSEDGRAEVHFSDDEHRHLVYLRIEIPIVGSMTLHLKAVREGTPLGR
jgi:hypothetical protein